MSARGRPARQLLRERWDILLVIAAGGALGGFFAAVIAPLIFNNYYELHWGVLACGALFLLVSFSERSSARMLCCLAMLRVASQANCTG